MVIVIFYAPNIIVFNSNDQYTLQISDSGMVLEEQPGKISEAFRLFLQGEGYGKWLAANFVASSPSYYKKFNCRT